MHPSSMQFMLDFVSRYLNANAPLTVLDVGSKNLNGTFKDLFKGWDYTGLDISEGANVDIVSEKPYNYPLPFESYDVVISGSCLEHVEAPWIWILECARVLKKGGLMAIVAPHTWEQHNCSIDCWRIFPDGMRYLLGTAGLEVLECYKQDTDTCGIARK